MNEFVIQCNFLISRRYFSDDTQPDSILTKLFVQLSTFSYVFTFRHFSHSFTRPCMYVTLTFDHKKQMLLFLNSIHKKTREKGQNKDKDKNKTKQNKTKQNKTKQNKTKNKTKNKIKNKTKNKTKKQRSCQNK